jgi:hypothetical protein
MRPYLTLCLAILGVMAFFSFSGKPVKVPDVVTKLEELGYFKYTSSHHIGEVKIEIQTNFEKSGALATVIDKALLPLDYRLYFCDAEQLFEEGGLEEYLAYAKHAFDKRGLTLHWENEILRETKTTLRHLVTVNGKEYTLYNGSLKDLRHRGIAQANFYTMINDQLELQTSDERLYPISGGEQGQFAFLTNEQFEYISSTFYQGKDVSRFDKIYSLADWKKVYELK